MPRCWQFSHPNFDDGVSLDPCEVEKQKELIRQLAPERLDWLDHEMTGQSRFGTSQLLTFGPFRMLPDFCYVPYTNCLNMERYTWTILISYNHFAMQKMMRLSPSPWTMESHGTYQPCNLNHLRFCIIIPSDVQLVWRCLWRIPSNSQVDIMIITSFTTSSTCTTQQHIPWLSCHS